MQHWERLEWLAGRSMILRRQTQGNKDAKVKVCFKFVCRKPIFVRCIRVSACLGNKFVPTMPDDERSQRPLILFSVQTTVLYWPCLKRWKKNKNNSPYIWWQLSFCSSHSHFYISTRREKKCLLREFLVPRLWLRSGQRKGGTGFGKDESYAAFHAGWL